MDTREYDALIKLIETSHGETIRSLGNIEKRFSTQFTKLDIVVQAHDRSLVRVKAVGTILGCIWTSIVLFFK